jgi:sialate O-acetylesterase
LAIPRFAGEWPVGVGGKYFCEWLAMKLSSLFSEHMVLQRGKDVPVWGWGTPGDQVTVEFGGQKGTAAVAADGKWQAKLRAMEASSEARQLVVRSQRGDGEIRIGDVLVGEVWLASGQSNMQWAVRDSNNASAEIAAANYPNIRLFTVPNLAVMSRQTNVDSAWKVCSPGSVESFSAVAYFFGRELHRELGIPIGLINSSWGGTRVEAWMSKEALLAHAETKKEIEAYEKMSIDPAVQMRWDEYAKNPLAWERANAAADPGNGAFAHGWAAEEFDDSKWETMHVPSRWQEFGHNYSGVFWFRREVTVPADWAGEDLVLHIGACDKHDTTYFNNTKVGGIGWETKNAWCTPRVYRIPAALVKPGKNVIATRVYSYLYHGGMIGPAEYLKVVRAGTDAEEISIQGQWRFAIEHNLGLITPVQPPMGAGNPNTIHILFDSMIWPLVPYAIGGAIWYQGESNADNPKLYRRLFPAMIRNWREAFGQGAFPFYYVELTNYMAPQAAASEGGWANLREAQAAVLKEPNTGRAVIIDVGDALDIHPRNKLDVGKRLARIALAKQFGKPMEFSGPVYGRHAVEGDSIRVTFDHAKGLKTRNGGAVEGFAVAGADGEFHWGEGKIMGEGVIVQSVSVREPRTVRYGWASNPKGNLINAAGLPAAGFRTDGEVEI